MRAADDFAVIRARMTELERERMVRQENEGPQRRFRAVPSEETKRVALKKTRELLERS